MPVSSIPSLGFLPPATPQQAQVVWALLHVTPRMVRLDRTYDALYFIEEALEIAFLLVFLGSGLSARLRDAAERGADQLLAWGVARRLVSFSARLDLVRRLAGNPAIAQGIKVFGATALGSKLAWHRRHWDVRGIRAAALYWIGYFAVLRLFWFPLSLWAGYVLPHEYGLSREPFISWLGDVAKLWAIDLLWQPFTAAILLWLIRLHPRRWPLLFALCAAPLVFVGIFFAPIVFDPIFNTYRPLPVTSPLYAPLHALAAKAGIPRAQIFVVDKSRQTEETNAYVTGLGSSARIVLWDTLIKKTPTDEIVAVTAHEIGHYVEHHVLIGAGIAVIALFVAFPLLRWSSLVLIRGWGSRWRLRGLDDPASLPVLLLTLNLLIFFSDPLTNAISRMIERRADAYGLGLSRNRIAAARSFVDLSEQNLSDPNPPAFIVFWLADHPPLGARITYALYGQPPEPSPPPETGGAR